MIHKGLRMGLRDPGVVQCCAPSCGALFATGATTEKSDAVLAVNVAYRAITLAGETKPVAGGIDTRESGEVVALHDVFLSYSWSLSRGTSDDPTPFVHFYDKLRT